MTILSNGNVGIGTTTPTALLDVNGDVIVAGDLTAENLIVSSTNVITELTSLDTLTASHTTDLATNTADILTKQATITSATDLDCNSLTTNNLEVNKSVHIDTSKYFNTIVIRRPTGTSGVVGDFFISLRELQVWIDAVNLLQTEGITAIFTDWTGDKITAIPERDPSGGVSYDAINLFNESFTSPNDVESKENQSNSNTAVIIRNIPLSLIETIQAIVLYSRNDADNQSTIGLAIELYNSMQDANLTEVLATTAEITTADDIYRFDFPAGLPKYLGGYPTTDSAIKIIDSTVATVEDVVVITNPTLMKGGLNLTGDLVVVGDLTANGVNINTTLADILSRLELLENP
jgi:hypothetical protein